LAAGYPGDGRDALSPANPPAATVAPVAAANIGNAAFTGGDVSSRGMESTRVRAAAGVQRESGLPPTGYAAGTSGSEAVIHAAAAACCISFVATACCTASTQAASAGKRTTVGPSMRKKIPHPGMAYSTLRCLLGRKPAVNINECSGQ
jgi:hypothetical protein